MSLYTVKPLADRSGFTGEQKRSAFTRRASDGSWRRESIPFPETRDLLARELKMVDATDVILEIDVLPGSIRLDGELYANAKVNSPAVRLHFESKHGHLSYQTDAFTTWRDNVRAIALALEALRKVDRYGIGRGNEQYRGYLALESGSGAVALGGMTRDEAFAIIGSFGTVPVMDQTDDDLRRAHRVARAKSHPDRQDGDRAMWDLVEQAARVLGLDS